LCLILLAWRAREDFPLVVAANRDEWRDRPTEPAHWWSGKHEIFAGRDLKAGGTWMGITRAGRFAAVTNFRDPTDKRSTARSRGELVTEYLRSAEPADLFILSISQRAGDYNGFSLIVGDTESMWYFGSHEGVAREIPPGVHGLSNHVLDEPWPKVTRGRAAMEEALRRKDPSSGLFTFLADSQGVADEALPKTGVGLEWERRLASPLITGRDYGTRSSTVLTLSASNKVHFEERTLDTDGAVVETRDQRLAVKPL
jgi:uncharacterized protein with NRDE domain